MKNYKEGRVPGQLVPPIWRTILCELAVPSTCIINSSSLISTPVGVACFCKCFMHLKSSRHQKLSTKMMRPSATFLVKSVAELGFLTKGFKI